MMAVRSRATEPPMLMAERPGVLAWLDDFFAAYYAHHPVNATFIGVHAHDHRLPDFSENGAGDALADLQDLLRRSDFVEDDLDPVDRIDLRLARGFLRIRSAEYESLHFHQGNPSTHTGEAIFGVLSLLLTDFGPEPERTGAAAARMNAIPALLEQAMDRIRSAPAPWTARALRECEGARILFTTGMRTYAGTRRTAPGFLTAANRAATAFERFGAHLEGMPSAGSIACGDALLDVYLRDGHCLAEGARDIAERAEAELQNAERDLAAGAKAFGAHTPDEALARLADEHPSVDGYYGRYGEIWRAMKERAVDEDLLTWPEFPIRYVPRPDWVRDAAPYLYFLYYRCPATFGAPEPHEYLVTPIDRGIPEPERTRLLRAHDDSVIRRNHVIHHGGIGHHVQNWHAARARSRVGQVAAVDCASRIAMFCGGTMAEGWACYATDLMAEHGALTPLERYAELRSRARMCARAVADVRLHTGRFSLADAAAFYVDRAGMSADAAKGEAVKNSMFPGAALMYMAGTDAIHTLRRSLESRPGFSLRTFHDEFLSWGSIPVAIVAEQMAGEAVAP